MIKENYNALAADVGIIESTGNFGTHILHILPNAKFLSFKVHVLSRHAVVN